MRSHRVSVPTVELSRSLDLSCVKEMSAGGDAFVMGNVSREEKSLG